MIRNDLITRIVQTLMMTISIQGMMSQFPSVLKKNPNLERQG